MPIHFGRRQQQQLAGWLPGWMAGWMAGWLTGWLTGWLAGQQQRSNTFEMPCKRRATKCTLKFYGRVAANGALCRMPEAVTQIGWMSECSAQDTRMRGWAHPGCQTMMMMTRHIRDDYDDASEDGRCCGSRRRPVVLPTWCSLQSIEVNAATSCSVSRSFLSLALTVSFFLPLTRCSFTHSLLLPLGPFLCAFARLLFLEKVKNNENSQAAIMAI